jgi:hypothetical protein
MSALDRFLDAYFYAADLADQGASKADHDRADTLLREKETALLSELNIDTNTEEGSAQFDRLLELADNYRQDERQYAALVTYVNEIAASLR